MEAPKKIYISIVPSEVGGYTYITCSKEFPHAVEYIRTDVFIEKAEEWMKKQGGIVDVMSFEMVRDFEKYMKGE